jgi:branched-chain amino acid transport system substrate-binding protein
MNKPIGLAATAAFVALSLAACGSSSKSSSQGGTSPGNSSTTAKPTGTPIRIAYMGIFHGQFATPGADNGFKLAVNEVNSSGGIMGRQLEYKEFDTDITPQGASTATSLALDYKPDVIIGYGVSGGLKASASQLKTANVVLIHNTLDALTSPTSLGTDLSFRLQPTVAQFAGAADRFLFGERKVKSMMVVNTQDAAPTDGAKQIVAGAAAAGVKTDHRAVPPTVTDLTEPALAAKSMNADAIWEWGYPTTDGLMVKTAAANGFKGDIMTFSAGAAAKAGLIPPSLLTDHIFSVTTQCAPQVLQTPVASKYAAAYKAAYGSPVTTAVANENYDAVYIYKQAVETAKSTSSTAVGTALQSIDYQGVCGQEKADANHNLEHSVTIINFPGGAETLAKLETNLDSPY